MGSGVVSSSLTSVGTIATGVWQGTAIAHTYIDTGIAENKIVKVSAADVASGEYARFTATGLESVTAAELKTALNISSGSSLWSEGSTSGEIYYTDGNVGIGTNDPGANFHVNSDTHLQKGLTTGAIYNNVLGSCALHLGGNSLYHDNKSTNADFDNVCPGHITWGHHYGSTGRIQGGFYQGLVKDVASTSATTAMRMDIGTLEGGNSGPNFLGTSSTDDALKNKYRPKLTVRANGNVGIGETNPTARLQIKGADDLSTGNTMDLVNDSGDALFHVQNDGKVGIGTDDPGYNLHVNGTGGTRLKVSNTTSERAIIELMTTNDEANDLFFGQNNDTRWSFSGRKSTEGYKLNIYPRVSGSWQSASMTFLQDGKIGIGNTSPSVKLEVTGDIKSSGTVTATNVVAVSDGSLKTNIQQLENSLDVIQKLKGVSYNWTDPDNHDDEIGLIAQDVEEVVPEVVRNLGNSSLKGIEYQKLTAILIEAVKELSGKLNELNNKVNN